MANELRRLLAPPGPGPAARRRRRPAARGPQRSAGPHARLVRRVLRALVAGVGGAGAAPRGTRGGRRRPRAAVPGADRPAALPGARARARTTSARSGGSRRGSRRSGCPRGADPRSAPQARPRRARRTSSGRCSCCSCGTPATVPELRTPSTLGALRAAAAAGLVAEPDADALAAAWRSPPGCATRSCSGAGRPADSLPTGVRELDGGRAARGLPARVGRAPGRRLPADDATRTQRRRAGVLRVTAGAAR